MKHLTSLFSFALLFTAALMVTSCGGGGGGGGGSADPIKVSFTLSPESEIVKESSINFTSAQTGAREESVTYSWSFGDGSSSSDANPTKAFTSAGDYNVTLTVQSGDKSASYSKEITVYEGVFSSTQRSAFQSVVDDSFASKNDKAGFNVTVLKGGYPAWSYALGKSSETSSMTTDTPVVLYSITKTITASMIMKLIEEGELSLTNTVSEALGSVANSLDSSIINKSATIEQLLNHTSGIREYTSSSQVGSFTFSMATGGEWSATKVLNLLEEEYSNVGEHYYSNTNYILLGMIVEKKSGTSLENYLKENLYNPYDIVGSLLPNDTKPSNIAEPYDDLEAQGGSSGVFGNLLSPQPFFFQGMGPLMWSAAAMSMTAQDLAKFGYELLGANGTLLSSLTQSTLFSSVSTASDNYGYGISKVTFTLDGEEKDLYGHGGGGAGYITILYYNPNTDIVVVVLSNGTNSTSSSSVDSFDGNELYNIVSGIINAY